LTGPSAPGYAARVLVAFAVLALADWIAVARGWRTLEYVAKPGALLALIGWAATGAPSPWLIAALAFSLAGDVFLMLPTDSFVPGLVAFLVGHLAYIGAFHAPIGSRLPWLMVPLAVSAVVGTRMLRAIPTDGMRALVALYSLAIAAMVASALASGTMAAAAGALLFLLSDTLIGWDRFVRRTAWAPLVIIVTYHLGQLGLTTALRHG